MAQISAVLLLLGIHPLGLYGLSWFGFLPLFLLLFDPDCDTRRLLGAGLLVGILYYGFGLYWLLYYELRIYLMVVLIFAPLFGIYFLTLRLMTGRFKNDSLKILAAAFLWWMIHKIFYLSPFGTGAVEASFYGPAALIQTARLPVLGFGMVPAMIVGINASLALLWKKRNFSSGVWLAIFSLLLLGIYFWGSQRLRAPAARPKIKMALIQHNLPLSGRWNMEHQNEIQETYRRLALEAAEQKPDLIIFPLYTFPGDPRRHPEFFTALARETGSFILIASHIPAKPGGTLMEGLFDMAILYSPEGKIAGDYRAVQAPPFRSIFEKTAGDYQILETPWGRIGVLLCYEDTTRRVARLAVKNKADILIALSNPGHFRKTYLPYYHLMQDRFRAVETGLPLARVSPNGYSAIIEGNGRIQKQTALNREEIVV